MRARWAAWYRNIRCKQTAHGKSSLRVPIRCGTKPPLFGNGVCAARRKPSFRSGGGRAAGLEKQPAGWAATQAWVWRRNAMNTAETRQSLFKKQPAHSQTGCRLLFAVDSADYLPRRPRPWFTIRWISAFISRMISRAMDCILASTISGTDCINSPSITPCLSKMLCPKGES